MRPPTKIPYVTITALLAVVVVFVLAAVGTTSGEGDWSSLAVITAVVLLNMGFWTAFWIDFWKPVVKKRLDAQKGGLERLEKQADNLSENIEGHQVAIGRMQTSLNTLPELERKIGELAAELDRRFSPPSRPPPASRPPAASPFTTFPAPGLSEPDPAPMAAPATAEVTIPAERSSDRPTQNTADLAREKLGALFVQEIRTASGTADAATVWDRYLARLPASFQALAQRQVHWDRDGLSLRFHAQPSGAYKDTGKCWLVQAGEQSLLFFPALAATTARKEDLPGCQTQSNDIVLYASKLARFIPPVATQTPDGWAIESEGTVEYR